MASKLLSVAIAVAYLSAGAFPGAGLSGIANQISKIKQSSESFGSLVNVAKKTNAPSLKSFEKCDKDTLDAFHTVSNGGVVEKNKIDTFKQYRVDFLHDAEVPENAQEKAELENAAEYLNVVYNALDNILNNLQTSPAGDSSPPDAGSNSGSGGSTAAGPNASSPAVPTSSADAAGTTSDASAPSAFPATLLCSIAAILLAFHGQ